MGLLLTVAVRGADTEKSTTSLRVEVVQTNFTFQGGSLAEWIDQLNKAYKVDLHHLGDIDSAATRQVRVPKMRLNTMSYWDVLQSYNGLAMLGAEGLGKWVLIGPPQQPQLIGYQPSADRPDSKVKVKAFYINLAPKKFEELYQIVQQTSDEARHRNAGKGSNQGGNLGLHSESGIVVAIGDESYLEIVSEIVNAFKDKPSPVSAP